MVIPFLAEASYPSHYKSIIYFIFKLEHKKVVPVSFAIYLFCNIIQSHLNSLLILVEFLIVVLKRKI